MPEYVRTNSGLTELGGLPGSMAPPNAEGPREFMQPLVQQWLSKMELGMEAKQEFSEVAFQCDSFFSKSSGFMWKPRYRGRYLGPGVSEPNWQVTINKAFEFVALYGPYLFWKYPQVFIESPDPLELSPELFGNPEDPQVQQMWQQAQQEMSADMQKQTLRNQLMERYLNWSQREQPYGGLQIHAELAITEALVKGRGMLVTTGYVPPGSQRQLTQREYRTVDDLIIDPDCKHPLWKDAKWVALKHEDVSWEFERMFDLPRGLMKNRGNTESMDSRATNRNDVAHRNRKEGKSHDIVEWYEIWSKGGIGSRLSHLDNPSRTMMSEPLHQAFDQAVGDYAYLCVAQNLPFPANAPSWKFRDPRTNSPIANDDEVYDMFSWRAANYGPVFPTYIDNRFPMEVLDFYKIYGSAWPVSPLSPGLGELTVLNALVSAYTESAYEGRKVIVAYLDSASKSIKSSLSGSQNPAYVAINDIAQKSINDVLQVFQRPEMNTDLIQAIGFYGEMFDKRVGLGPLWYAMGGTQSRSARDVSAKEERMAIRPEKMANDVGSWISRSAQSEKFLAGWIVKGQSLMPLLGRYGAYFWDELIANEDPEVIVREMRATVEASDMRKPNRDRLLANMQEMNQFFLPILQEYSTMTGDEKPMNEYLENMNRAMEEDIAPQFGPWRPEPDPEQQQMQQMQMQMEQAKLQADVQKQQMEAAKAKFEMEQEAGAAETEAIRKQMELQFDQVEHDQEQDQDDEKHDQEVQQSQEKHILDILQKRQEGALKLEQMQRENALRQAMIKAKPKTNGEKSGAK